MPVDIEALAATVAELQARLDKPKPTKDPRPCVVFRINRDELALLDAACTQRGLCRSDVVRLGLNAVIGSAMPIQRAIPAGLMGRRNRKKLSRYTDEKTSVPLRDAATVRDLAAKAYSAQVEYQQAARDADGATAARVRHSPEMMADSAGPLFTGKLSR